MSYAFALVVGLVLGAADQYLGSRIGLGAWAAAVSQMSAPWLVLPFLAGATQVKVRQAMVMGLVITAGALLGYFAMTYSPAEGFPLSRLLPGTLLMMRTGYNPLWIAGGLVGGPLFGFLGQRWRTRRWWVSGASVVFIVVLEPLARALIGWLPTPRWPAAIESIVGIVAAVSLLAAGLASKRQSVADPYAHSDPA